LNEGIVVLGSAIMAVALKIAERVDSTIQADDMVILH
jgi:hypothetical protein